MHEKEKMKTLKNDLHRIKELHGKKSIRGATEIITGTQGSGSAATAEAPDAPERLGKLAPRNGAHTQPKKGVHEKPSNSYSKI